MKTVFADVKLWVLGRSEPLPLVLQSMMSGITCQLITKTGRAFFYTLFTYKEPPSSFILTILKKRVLTNCSQCSFLALRLFFIFLF